MRISELTAGYVASWTGLCAPGEEPDEAGAAEIMTALASAKSQAVGYTGVSIEELDEFEDVTIAILGLCNDALTGNRPEAAEGAMNKMSEGILAMHCRNFL